MAAKGRQPLLCFALLGSEIKVLDSQCGSSGISSHGFQMFPLNCGFICFLLCLIGTELPGSSGLPNSWFSSLPLPSPSPPIPSFRIRLLHAQQPLHTYWSQLFRCHSSRGQSRHCNVEWSELVLRDQWDFLWSHRGVRGLHHSGPWCQIHRGRNRQRNLCPRQECRCCKRCRVALHCHLQRREWFGQQHTLLQGFWFGFQCGQRPDGADDLWGNRQVQTCSRLCKCSRHRACWCACKFCQLYYEVRRPFVLLKIARVCTRMASMLHETLI